MKAMTSSHNSMFLHAPLPLSSSWGETRQQIRRAPRALPQPSLSLSTDELAASKSEIVCGGVLAMCFFYTLIHLVAQLAA